MGQGDTRGNILLVDDTPNNIRLLSAMLIDQGYEVRRVINGQMALKTAQASPPDLILLDIKMPDMNGYEVCQRLKAAIETKDIPVIFISALDEVLDKVKAFAVGGVDYITKPFSEEEVFARVENVLTVQRLQRRLQEQNESLDQEIQKRHQLEENLQRQQSTYQFLWNSPVLGIFRTRIDGLILEANQRFIEMLGYNSSTEVIGQITLSQHYTDLDSQTHLLAELPGTPQDFSSKTQFRKCDNSQFWGRLFLRLNQENTAIDGVLVEL
ncbi:MAG: response regulator [Oscillatoriophycideae cyanobacterium NC_groundwater_1537_Pr4_S-0.65um_50_18]|nr:response regulator [Oscillatoriophycideae cyanobacterium NC_groundwater_1537_Pr4_S-0.65um_50_18]